MNENKEINRSTRFYLRLTGVLYLVTMTGAVFNEFIVREGLIQRGNISGTVEAILQDERLFRLGIASELVTAALILALSFSLYRIFSDRFKDAAKLAFVFRCVEVCIWTVITIFSIAVLLLLTREVYVDFLNPNTKHALANLFLSVHGNGYYVGMVFFSIGSIIYNMLFFRSNYIPKILAVIGIIGAVMLLLGTLAIIIDPENASVVEPAFMLPIFLFEVGTGFWLLLDRRRLYS